MPLSHRRLSWRRLGAVCAVTSPKADQGQRSPQQTSDTAPGHIEVGNCPVCGAFPTQFVNGGESGTSYCKFAGGYIAAERDALAAQVRELRSQADALAGALERAEQYIADDGRKPGRKLPANAALADIRSALAAYRGQQP